LNPKTPDNLIEEFCALNNLDKALVKDILECYWREIKNTLVNLEYPHILIKGLGTFSVSKKKV